MRQLVDKKEINSLTISPNFVSLEVLNDSYPIPRDLLNKRQF